MLRLSLLLLCLTAPLVAQNFEAYLQLTPEQQDSAVRATATKAIAVFTASRPASLSIEQARLYELHRTFGNFIAVLFLTDPAHPDVELSNYAEIRATEIKNAKLSPNEDLGHVVGAYVEETFRFLDGNGGRLTAALSNLSTKSNPEQVVFLRQLYDQRSREINDNAASKQIAENKQIAPTRPNTLTEHESGALSSAGQNRSLTVEMVEAMPDQQRTEYLKGFIIKAEAALAEARDKATTQQDRKSQQLALSITTALFGGPNEGWSEIHKQPWNLPIGIEAVLRGAADSDRRQPLGPFIGAYVEHRYAELQQHPAISWLPQQDDFYQEAFARMVFAAPPLASIDCKTMEDDMLEGSIDALVERAATNRYQKLTTPSNGSVPATNAETSRMTANLLKALFFGDGPITASPPAIYDDARCRVLDSGTFIHHLSGVVDLKIEEMTPWVRAADSDSDQQNGFRYLSAFDNAYGTGVRSWFGEYGFADLHRAIESELVGLAVEKLTIADLREAARTVTLYNDGRPAVSGADKLNTQLKPLKDAMPGFDAASKRVLDEFIRPFVSPIDQAGRHKQPSEALAERQRGDNLLKIVSGKYSDQVAKEIYTTYRKTGAVNFDEVFRKYISQELSRE